MTNKDLIINQARISLLFSIEFSDLQLGHIHIDSFFLVELIQSGHIHMLHMQ